MNIVKISDGLGNQMFQYAFARKLSVLTGKSVYLDSRFINNEDLAQKDQNALLMKQTSHREFKLPFFRIKLPIAGSKELLYWNYLQQLNGIQKTVYELSLHDMWIWKYKEEDTNFSGELSRGILTFPAYYRGYFFDLKYYDGMEEILRSEFSPKKEIKLRHNLKEILNKRETVSLHIRRGDFLKVNRDISSSGYYDKAIKIIENNILHPVYLIFSDDIEWVKKNLNVRSEKIFVSGMGFQDYEELTIMRYCKHNIIANSTFSYWGAYLNANSNKMVICPKYWKTKIIPKGWISI